jgi:hypothetical protein
MQLVLCPAMGASLEDMPCVNLLCLRGLSLLPVSSDAALCADYLQGRVSRPNDLLEKVRRGTKRRLRPKQQDMAPSLRDANERVDEWREPAFRMDGGGGGNGDSM